MTVLMTEAKVVVDTLENKVLALYSKRDSRNLIIQEMLETERDLYDDLKLCIEGYLDPACPLAVAVDTEGVPLFSAKQRERLFCNIEDLLGVSTLLMTGLEATMKRDHEGMLIGRIFRQAAARMKDAYVTYVVNFDDATTTLNELNSDPMMKGLLRACHANISSRTKAWDLNSFLIKPVQRVLKYPLLLRELLKKTKPNHVDFEDLTAAEEAMKEVAKTINEKKRTKELLEKYVTKSETRNPHGMMHSLGKKSMRIGQKVRMKVSSAGEGFEEYGQHEKTLHDIESDCKRLRKRGEEYLKSKEDAALALEAYTKSIYEFFLGKHFKSTTSVDDTAQMGEICVAMTNLAKYTREHVEAIRVSIIGNGGALNRLLLGLVNPLILVAKRADKRLDYESYKRKYRAAEGDEEKRAVLAGQLALAKNTFTALHDQLSEDLSGNFDIIFGPVSHISQIIFPHTRARRSCRVACFS